MGGGISENESFVSWQDKLLSKLPGTDGDLVTSKLVLQMARVGFWHRENGLLRTQEVSISDISLS